MAMMTAIMLGGLVIQGVQAIRAAQAAKREGQAGQRVAEAQADLADYNAAVADVQAKDALERGAEEQSRFLVGVRGMIGTQRTGFAAGNIDVSSGSAVDVQADTAYLGALDAATIKTNAAREAWGLGMQGEDLRRRAEIARKEGVMVAATGRANATSAYLGGAGSLVTSTASLFQSKYGFGGSGTRPLPSRTTVPGASAGYPR